MRNISLIFLTVAAISSLAPMGRYQGRQPNPHDLVGKAAPQLVVDKWLSTNGKPLSLGSLKGKVVVLDFWAFG